jgi:signal transduction histidine kinase
LRWANPSGIAFWQVDGLEALQAVSLDDWPPETCRRLQDLARTLTDADHVTETLSVGPGGLPQKAICALWPVDWQGESCLAMMVLPALPHDPDVELRLRDHILEAVARSAQRLLHGRGWTREAPALLQALGRAAEVDRSYFFRFLPAEPGTPDHAAWVADQEFEWCAADVEPQIDNPDLQGIDMVAAGFPRWIESFKRGEPVVASSHGEIPPSERAVLDPQDIRAICIQPVISERTLAGFVGFDIVGTRRARRFHGWTPQIVDALAVAAHLIGAALKMDQTQTRLARALADAQAASLAKSKFLATVSHELRTPLNAINGFSQMMIRRVFGPLGDPHYEDYARDIHASGEHLLSLINDILDMSKIEAGRMTLNEQELSLAEAIATAAGLVRARAADRRLALDTELPDNLPAIRADPRALQQMLLNLLSNAVKFTPEGGRIFVTACPTGEGGLAITVADTGVGIALEDQGAVFEPFRQAPAGRAAAEGGTGLGLSLVKSLIELHGGTIDLTSAPGAGTTVTLAFPPGRKTRSGVTPGKALFGT